MTDNEKFFVSRYDQFYKMALRVCKNRDNAQDLLHKVYLVVRDYDDLIVTNSFIFTALQNTWKNNLRHESRYWYAPKSVGMARFTESRKSEFFDKFPAEEQDIYDIETRLQLQKEIVNPLLEELPKKQREVITELLTTGEYDESYNHNTRKINRRLAVAKLSEMIKERKLDECL